MAPAKLMNLNIFVSAQSMCAVFSEMLRADIYCEMYATVINEDSAAFITNRQQQAVLWHLVDGSRHL